MLTYRDQQDTPLTITQLDDNFRTLDDRLQRLEQAQSLPELPVHIAVVDEVLIFTGSQGTVMARVHLPKVAFNPQGCWESLRAYYTGDVVVHDQQTWYCIAPHQSAVFDTLCWRLLFDTRSKPTENSPANPMSTTADKTAAAPITTDKPAATPLTKTEVSS